MKDIAKNLGVSHVTVSYALRGIRRISEEMRKKVCEEADRLGYKPDPVLQALSSYRRENRSARIHSALAWLCCWESTSRMYSYKEFSEYKRGAEYVANKLGYHLEEFSPVGDMPPQRVQHILRSRGIRGVLIPPRQSNLAIDLSCFHQPDLAVVKFGHSHDNFSAHLVTSAHVYNTILAYENMLRLGYRRIGFVISKWTARRTHFLSGFLRAQLESSSEDRVNALQIDEEDMVSLKSEALAEWIKKEKPDAILTPISGMQKMLNHAQLRVPDDVGLATLSIHDGNADSGIDQNPFEIGRAACEMVTANIIHNLFGPPEFPRELLVEGKWVSGSSLPAKS